MKPAKVSVGFLHPGQWAACFGESLIGLLWYDAGLHGRMAHPHGKLGKECGSGGIVDGRNKLAQVMCDESGADWLFMVDSDMGFAPDTVERLVDAADPKLRPVVGGLAFAQKTDGGSEFFGIRYRAQPTLYDWFEDDDRAGFVPRFKYPANELVTVGATGGAMVLIHRSALEAVRDKYGDVWFDTIRHPKGAHLSEDLSFCIRLAACDIPLHVHTGIRSTHDKGFVYLDEEFYFAQEHAAGRRDTPPPLPPVPPTVPQNRAQRRAARRAA